MIEEQKNEPLYRLIDCNALSLCLAEDAWKEETKNYVDDDLYETVIESIQGEEGNVRMKKQPRERWASLFFDLKSNYMKLIESFSK